MARLAAASLAARDVWSKRREVAVRREAGRRHRCAVALRMAQRPCAAPHSREGAAKVKVNKIYVPPADAPRLEELIINSMVGKSDAGGIEATPQSGGKRK